MFVCDMPPQILIKKVQFVSHARNYALATLGHATPRPSGIILDDAVIKLGALASIEYNARTALR